MSKNAQAECKVETRFQTLLRRSRFSRRSLKERNERQDTILPPIHRLSIHFVIEPLDIGLISSSFRSFLFCYNCFCFVIKLCFSAAKVYKKYESSKFSDHFFKLLPNKQVRPDAFTYVPYSSENIFCAPIRNCNDTKIKQECSCYICV